MSVTRLHRLGSSARPLSYAQERLWFLDQINPGDPSANLCRAFRIQGDLKPDVLKQSLQAVVNRHESLRTTFATTELDAGVDSKPVQLIATNLTVDVASIDLSLVAREQRQVKARELARAEAQRSFDLTLGPLFSVTLVKLEERDHVLILNVRRAICDEQSVDLLLRDVAEHYRAILKQANPELASLPIQFAEFAERQLEQVNGEEFQIHRDYWKEKLSAAPVVIELPTAGARPAIRSWRGESHSFQIERPLYEALKSVSSENDVDLFTTLTAAFQLLISRYSGQKDVVIGSTLPNREVAETRNLIGPLANAVALRSDLSGNPTFEQLLRRVKENIVSARKHAAMPFERLLDELQVERSLSHAPVFQIALNLEEKHDSHAWSEGLSVEEFAFESGIAALDLSLDIVEDADRLDCRIGYASDLFERQTIASFADHFVRLLGEIARNPERRTGYFNFLSPEELNKSLREWNNTAISVAAETFCQSFESQVRQTPNAVAVQFGDTTLTYAELNRKANQLARYLEERGVGPEKLVGLFLVRSHELVIALLGTLKAGGAYLPLDISYPPDRLSFMLADAAVPVVLTQERLLPLLPQCDAEIICVDRDSAELARQSDTNPVPRVTGDNVAYVIYTSGSTGKPKGVQVIQSALANLLSSMRQQPSISPSDTLLSVTTLSFDIATLEVCLPLTVGARVVIAGREEAMDAAVLAKLIEQCGATLMQATPATWRLLLAAGWKGNEKLRIISGGEPLSRHHADQLLERTDELWNQYGPTETTIYSTVKHIASTAGEVTVGKPIANTQVYVLDPHFQPVPVGVTGELCIGGDGLARGYLRRPELTAERFIPNPFSTSPGQRIYRTGDLARFDKNGEVELLGRLDHQVKLRGYRIELGEIESVLNSHPLVGQSVVTVSPDSSGEQRLTAYFVPDPQALSGAIGIERPLRDHLRVHLPDYMVPQNLLMIEAFPLTPNGKIDRRLLPKPDTFSRVGANYVAPRDNLEKQVAAMWEAVLGIKPVGSTDNFFELGGHSLLAARLFAQIENRLGKHIPLATLFQAPTVEQLSNVLRGSEVKEEWPSVVAIQSEGSKPPLFCIHAAGANVLIYRPLSRHLGNDQPVYALQAQGLDGQTKPYTRVEDMAAHYIREMRERQPEGPYHLVGASFGGLVIYEMALQLSQQGQKVGLLAMLNTNCPVYTFRKRIASHAVHLVQEGPRFYTRGVIQGIGRRLGIEFKAENSGSGASDDPELQQVLMSRGDVDEALVRTVLAIIKADESYVPSGRIANKITYFRAIDAAVDFHDNRLGWRHLTTGGFEVYDVPGTHTSMREEPRVAELVKKLKPCLDRAQA